MTPLGIEYPLLGGDLRPSTSRPRWWRRPAPPGHDAGRVGRRRAGCCRSTAVRPPGGVTSGMKFVQTKPMSPASAPPPRRPHDLQAAAATAMPDRSRPARAPRIRVGRPAQPRLRVRRRRSRAARVRAGEDSGCHRGSRVPGPPARRPLVRVPAELQSTRSPPALVISGEPTRKAPANGAGRRSAPAARRHSGRQPRRISDVRRVLMLVVYPGARASRRLGPGARKPSEGDIL